MTDMSIAPTDVHFGTQQNNTLSVGPGAFVAFGLDGNDTLESRWDNWDWSLGTLAGGAGDDTYYANGDVTEIIEISGTDTLHVPGLAEDYIGGFLDGQDLVLVNQWSGQVILVMDFKNAGRVEHFVDSSGRTMSATQVEDLVYQAGYGDVDYAQLQDFTGDYSLDHSTFQALREIDIRMARIDWDPVFRSLEQLNDFDNQDIATAIEAELLPQLSPLARQIWDESNYHEALVQSNYHGIGDNLSPRVTTVAPRELVENTGLLYEAALNRMPDEEGLNYWAEQVANGMEMREVTLRFLDADEFRHNFNATTNEAFVEQIYTNVLNRSPDDAGMRYWVEELNSGQMQQADVLSRIADSPENRGQAEWMSGLTLDEASGDWLILG